MSQSESQTSGKYFHQSPFTSRGFHNFDTSAQLPRHRWYYFKEGFSASLVEEAIRKVEGVARRNVRVLEPFCGSGTTPLVASLLGHYCAAVEVNPFLAFVATVKTAPGVWDRESFLANLAEIVHYSELERVSPLEEFSTFSEKDGLDKWLFNKEVLRKYESIMRAIDNSSPEFQDAFALAAIVAAFDCSNAKRDGKGLRYKKEWGQRQYSGNDVLNKFREQAQIIIDDNGIYPIALENRSNIINADSRIALSTVGEDFDLVVTSPPYLNSFDYTDVYRPELFLGNYVNDNKGLYSLRLNTIRSHVQADWPKETSVECDLLTPILEKLNKAENLWNARIPLMVKAYFDDLNQVINNIAPRLRSKGQVWIVVSTSAYGGVHIPVDLILAELAHEAGLTLLGIHRLRDLRTSSQQSIQLNAKQLPLRESLIILTKP